MFTDQALLVLLFKAINFGIIVILAMQLYKHYLKPLLEQTMNDLHVIYQHLYKAKTALAEQQHDINQRAQEQRALSEELSRKIQQWHTVVTQQKQSQVHEAQLLEQRLIKKYNEQQHQVLIEQLRKQIGMRVLHEMKEELTDSFAHTSQARSYLHTVIESIKDRV